MQKRHNNTRLWTLRRYDGTRRAKRNKEGNEDTLAVVFDASQEHARDAITKEKLTV